MRPFRRYLALSAVTLAVLTMTAQAGEYAILTSGLRIRADRHEIQGGVTRLFQKDGVTELPSRAVAGYEQDDYSVLPAEQPPVAPRVAVAARVLDPKAEVRRAAARSGLPAALVESVARVESGFRADAVSPKGAIGVMQLMPATARALGADAHDVGQNIDAGARLLRELLLKYNGDVVKALAAYNAGTGAVERFGGLPPYQETRQYVNKVIGAYRQAGGR